MIFYYKIYMDRKRVNNNTQCHSLENNDYITTKYCFIYLWIPKTKWYIFLKMSQGFNVVGAPVILCKFLTIMSLCKTVSWLL